MADSTRDELSFLLAEALNENGEKKAFFLDDLDNPANVKDWISTGCDILDLAISNRPHGGLAAGRITQITGLEQTGKSLIAAQILAETQKKGGVSVFIDTENAISMDFLMALGVDVSKMVYVQCDLIEDVFSSIEKIIEIVRKKSKNKLVSIVVDSVAASTTAAEQEADYGKDGWATGKAIIISKALRKITNTIGREQITLVFTNQLRMKLGVGFGDPYTTSGGKALGFHSSTILRLKNLGMIKKTINGVPTVIGIKVMAHITKNRLGPPHRKVVFDLFYDRGVDNSSSWWKILEEHKNIATKSGQTITFTDKNGKDHKFTSKKLADIMENDLELREEIYQRICEELIMVYSKEKEVIDPSELVYESEEELLK